MFPRLRLQFAGVLPKEKGFVKIETLQLNPGKTSS